MNRTQEDQVPARMAATIRPPDSADLTALTGFFAGLSMQSRFQRFFAPVRLTPAMLRRLSGIAGHTDALIAIRGGVIIGHAMAADRTTPGDGPATDIGVVVADSWQGQGVGSALVRALISQAQARGVTALTMDVLPSNQRVLAMIAAHWATAGTDRSADYVTVQVPLPRTQAAESELTPAAPERAAHWRNDQAIAAAGPAAIA